MTESTGKLVEEYIESDPFLKELFAFSKQPQRKDNTLYQLTQQQQVLPPKENRTMGQSKLGTILSEHKSRMSSKLLEVKVNEKTSTDNSGTDQGTYNKNSRNSIQYCQGQYLKSVSPYLPQNQIEKTQHLSQGISNPRKSDKQYEQLKENLTKNQSNQQNLHHSTCFNDSIQGNNTSNQDNSGIDLNQIQFNHFSIIKQTNRNINTSFPKKNIRNHSSSFVSSQRDVNCQLNQKILQQQQQFLQNTWVNSSSQKILSKIIQPQDHQSCANIPNQELSRNKRELKFKEESFDSKNQGQRNCKTERDYEHNANLQQQPIQTIETQLFSVQSFQNSVMGFVDSPQIDFSQELNQLLNQHVLKRNVEHNMSEYLTSLQNISLVEAIYLQILLLITEQNNKFAGQNALRDQANNALERAYFHVFSDFNKGNKDIVQRLIVFDCYLAIRLCFQQFKKLREKCSLVGLFNSVILITHMTTGFLVSDAFVAVHINLLFRDTFMQYENIEQEELSQRVASLRRNEHHNQMNISDSISFLGVQFQQPSSSQLISDLGLQIQGQQHPSGVKSVTQLTHLPLKVPDSLFPSVIKLQKSQNDPPLDDSSINKSANVSTHRRSNSEYCKNSKFNCAATGNIIGKLLDSKLLKSVQGNIITHQIKGDTQKQRRKLQFMLEDLQNTRLKRAQSVACQRSSIQEDKSYSDITTQNADEYKLNCTEQNLAKNSWIRSGNEQINHTFLQKPIQLNYLLNKIRLKDKQNQVKDRKQSDVAEKFILRLRKRALSSCSSSNLVGRDKVKTTQDQYQDHSIIADQENLNEQKDQQEDQKEENKHINNNSRYISPADRAKQPVIEARKMIRQTDKMINTLRYFFK